MRSSRSNCQSLTKIVQPGRRPRRVRRGRRIADVGADRKVAVFVREHALEHEELLAAAMGVRREAGSRRVADDRSRARHLVADAIEHAPLDPGDWRGVHGSRAAWTAARCEKSAFISIASLLTGLRHARSLSDAQPARSGERPVLSGSGIGHALPNISSKPYASSAVPTQANGRVQPAHLPDSLSPRQFSSFALSD